MPLGGRALAIDQVLEIGPNTMPHTTRGTIEVYRFSSETASLNDGAP